MGGLGWRRIGALIVGIASAALLQGFASLPAPVPRPPSTACSDTGATPFARLWLRLLARLVAEDLRYGRRRHQGAGGNGPRPAAELNPVSAGASAPAQRRRDRRRGRVQALQQQVQADHQHDADGDEDDDRRQVGGAQQVGQRSVGAA